MSLNGVQPVGSMFFSVRLIEGISLNGVQTVFRVSAILQVIEKMERETGFEPATSSLGRRL
jgi:hypothetical protein